MEGHPEAQERVSNPALVFPGTKDLQEKDKAARQVGILMRRVFREGNEVQVDGFTVERGQSAYEKPSGDTDIMRFYTIRRG